MEGLNSGIFLTESIWIWIRFVLHQVPDRFSLFQFNLRVRTTINFCSIQCLIWVRGRGQSLGRKRDDISINLKIDLCFSKLETYFLCGLMVQSVSDRNSRESGIDIAPPLLPIFLFLLGGGKNALEMSTLEWCRAWNSLLLIVLRWSMIREVLKSYRVLISIPQCGT